MSKISRVVINANAGATSRIENKHKSGKQTEKKTISANNFSFSQDKIEEKRNLAREKARKVLDKVMNSDMEKSDSFKLRRENIEAMKREATEARSIVNDVNEKLSNLQKEYGVQDGSEEQNDLELLEKRIDSQRDTSKIRLTKEEKARLAEIDAKGLTEYQERSIRTYELGSVYNEKAAILQRKIDEEIKSLQAAKLDDLKSAPMVDAAKEADKIMEAANKEAVAALLEEAKENIDKKMEEEKAKGEEKAEEQEKLEELLDRDDEDEKDDITEDMPLDEVVKTDELRREMNKIVKDTGLSQEDLVGLAVDEEA